MATKKITKKVTRKSPAKSASKKAPAKKVTKRTPRKKLIEEANTLIDGLVQERIESTQQPEKAAPAEQTNGVADEFARNTSAAMQEMFANTARLVGGIVHNRMQQHIDNAEVLHARMAQHESVQQLLEIEKRFAFIGSMDSNDRAILEAERELARRVYERNTEAFEKAARKAGA